MNPHILIVIDEIGDDDLPRLDAQGKTDPVDGPRRNAVGLDAAQELQKRFPAARPNYHHSRLGPPGGPACARWASARSFKNPDMYSSSETDFDTPDRVRDAAPYPGRIPEPVSGPVACVSPVRTGLY